MSREGGFWARMRPDAGRASRSPLATWFFDIDRVLLLIALLLIAIGLLAVAAASPASAYRYSTERRHFDALYYLWRQLLWVSLSLPVLFGVSMLPIATARRLALAGCALFLLCLMLVPFVGVEVNGARRWLGVSFAQFQPSEFLKPCFVVALAWLLSLREKDPDLPIVPLTVGLLGGVVGLLMLQPDFGQSVVFALIWLALLTIAGVPLRVLGLILSAAPLLLLAAYMFYGTAQARINAFLGIATDGATADDYQMRAAHATITGGGWLGTGPGGGTVKFKLPEAHTDYIFSVIGEEFGLVACAVITLLYFALVARVFLRLLDESDSFRMLAAAGLATQFGVQALISIAVNIGIAPSKGMTLPFISYGGSSMLALSVGMGLLLAFTRRNPFLKRSPYIVKWNKP